MIICAAIKYEDTIICGPRHFDGIMRQVMGGILWKVPSSQWQQGFVDERGNFYDRKTAMLHALECDQHIDIERGCGGDSTTLYSEGLY